MMEKDRIDDVIVKKFNINYGDGTFESLPFRSEGGTREMLAQLFHEVGYTTGAEIGVFRGVYSEILCRENSDLKLKSIDPWIPFRGKSVERMEGHFIRASRRLRRYGAEVIRKTSMEAVLDVPDKSLDFVYIDAMHEFDPVMLDLIMWSGKVKSGGIVAGHDYTAPRWYNGVIAAVQAYTKAHEILRWYITDEPEPSYFWVKP